MRLGERRSFVSVILRKRGSLSGSCSSARTDFRFEVLIVSRLPVVRGHCQTISSIGMALAFVGSRIDPAEFAKPGRTLLVVLSLPGCAIEAVVKTVTHQRIENPDGPTSWFVGASLVQISDADRSRLSDYLDKQSRK